MDNEPQKPQKYSFGEIAAMARENAESFSIAVIGEKPNHKTASEIRFFENNSLVVYINGPRIGTFKSFNDDSVKGDMIELCTWARGMNKHEAILFAKDLLGLAENSLSNVSAPKLKLKTKEEKEKEFAEENAKKIRVANWIWDNSSETIGRKEGEEYLKNRGLKGPFDKNLIRFKVIKPEDLKKMGAKAHQIPKTKVVSIVFKATDINGNLTAVQQILTTQGKKLNQVIKDFGNVKKTNGLLSGSAVKLGGETPESVILAEGPETALSIYEAIKKPVWITLGTANYTKVKLPTTIKEGIIAAEIEESGAGLSSSIRAAQHWIKVGIPKFGIAVPRLKEGDANDVLQKDGIKAVKAMIDNTFYSPKPRANDSVLITPDGRAAFHVWHKTGIETRVRIPGIHGMTGKRNPISLEGLVEDHHKQVLIIKRKGFEILSDSFKKSHPNIKLHILSENSDDFLNKAKNPHYVEQSISNLVDIYAPSGLGEKEPVAFCLRRKDADALHSAGHKSIAVRSTGLNTINFEFMKNRNAILCPIGEGVKEDDILESKLKKAGAYTTRLKWQLFKPDGDGYKIVRKEIPENYGASDAVKEGWGGAPMKNLLKISEKKIEPEVKPKTENKKNKTKIQER